MTLNKIFIDFDEGINKLLLDTPRRSMALDAVALAPFYKFPWIEENQKDIIVFEVESDDLPSNWKIFEDTQASNTKYVR